MSTCTLSAYTILALIFAAYSIGVLHQSASRTNSDAHFFAVLAAVTAAVIFIVRMTIAFNVP